MRRAVLICPGRGSYGKDELGYLARHHAGKSSVTDEFDALRAASGQQPVTALDGAERFSPGTYSRGDVASPLIYAASYCDALSLAGDIEVVAVTGNSMGWYTALAVGGAVSARDGFRIVNTMGGLMQQHLIGGQLIYPFVGEDWRDDPRRKADLLAGVEDIDSRAEHVLGLSIDLGGMLVLAGNEAGLKAFEASHPRMQGRFPMRLTNHAGFHTALQRPVAQEGRQLLPPDMFGGPRFPLIDGRGHIWWPYSSNRDRLWDYTLGHQVTEPYDFTRAVATAAREFAPDLFIVLGPGTTMGGAVAQSLILSGWRGMTCRGDFREQSRRAAFVINFGDPMQRAGVSKTGDEDQSKTAVP